MITIHKIDGQFNINGQFINGTRVTAEWLNSSQNELCNVIESAGLTLNNSSTDTQTQLYTAITSLIGIYTYSSTLDGREQIITPNDSVIIDWSSGATATLSLNRASTAITMSNPINGKVYRILLAQDGTGSRLVTWTDTIRWRGGSASTLTTTLNKSDWVTLIYTGSTWYADISLNF